MKSKAARTKPKKLIRRTSAHARVATEVKVAVHKKSFRAHPANKGVRGTVLRTKLTAPEPRIARAPELVQDKNEKILQN